MFSFVRKNYSPTTSLYFSKSLQSEVVSGQIVSIDDNIFYANDCVVIVRYIGSTQLQWLKKQSFLKVFYVVDDHPNAIPSWAESLGVLKSWRSFVANQFDDFLPLITDVVSPSKIILGEFDGNVDKHLLNPVNIYQAPSLDHHDDRSKPFKVAFLGTGSHVKDLEVISEQLKQFLKEYGDVRCEMFMGELLPQNLLGLKNLKNKKPMSWKGYQKFCSKERFHLVIAPLEYTLFNKSRSVSKFYDCISVGAMGLFSGFGPFELLSDNASLKDCLVDNVCGWYDNLVYCYENRDHTRAQAERLASRFSGDECFSKQRSFWLEKLSF